MIDAHAHLQEKEFEHDLEEVIEKAKKAGIKAIFNASVDLESSKKALELAQSFDIIKPVIGLAPYSDLGELKEVLKLIEKHAGEIAAIGEIGLDWKYRKHEEQIPAFKAQVELAKELGLAVVVHSRSAGKYCIKFLLEWEAEKVLMHSFDGSLKFARLGFEHGFYFSIPMTVLKSEQKQKLAKTLPLDKLLLETDSPVLNPFGGRNEPANIIHSYRFVAELRGISFEELEKATEENARKLFRW